jgi:hypothetical protein
MDLSTKLKITAVMAAVLMAVVWSLPARLKLPIVNFRRPIGRRNPETLRRGVRRLL